MTQHPPPITPEALEAACPLCRPALWRREILEHILAHARSIEAGRRARASARKLTPEARQARARHASNARWKRAKPDPYSAQDRKTIESWRRKE